MSHSGFEGSQWEGARTERNAIPSRYACRRQMVPGSKFVKEIQIIQLEKSSSTW